MSKKKNMDKAKAIIDSMPDEIAGIDITPPNDKAKTWAADIVNKSSKTHGKLLTQAIKNKSPFHIAFLLYIPYKDATFSKKGIPNIQAQEALHDCVISNHLDGVKLIDQIRTVSPGDYTKNTFLKLASEDIALYLIQDSQIDMTNVRTNFFSGLYSAISTKSLNTIKALVESGENILRTPDTTLRIAKEQQCPEIYHYLKSEIETLQAQYDTPPAIDSGSLNGHDKKGRSDDKTSDKTWEKITNTVIAQHLKIENGQSQMTRIYDFDDQQMTIVYQKNGQAPSAPTVQNFDDLPRSEKISTAFNALVKKDGTPPPYTPRVVRKPKNSENTVKIQK